MKKILLLFLLLFTVGCESPFDKYKDSVSDLQAILDANIASAAKVEQNLSNISTIVTGVTDWENLSDANVTALSTNFSAIAAEITAGNMDVLLANIADYPQETDELVNNIETYKGEILEAINDPAITPEKKTALQSVLGSVEDVVDYLDLKGVI